MKRLTLLAVAALLAFSVVAQNADQVTLANAPRIELKLPKGAKGKLCLPKGYACDGEILFENERKWTVKRA